MRAEMKSQVLESMSRLANGVSIVTTEVGERPWGLTISSFSCISIEPPLVLISLKSETASVDAISKTESFGVSVLGRHQIDVARAGCAPGKPKYFDDYVKITGDIYVVDDSVVTLGCDVYKTISVGDHHIFIGSVNHVEIGGHQEPLLYSKRQFGTFVGDRYRDERSSVLKETDVSNHSCETVN